LLTASSAVALAGCGGDNATVERSRPGPTIEQATAEQLAGRSDEVARLLEAGDNCAARAEGDRLRADLTAAINRRVIPEVYLEDLSGLLNEIYAQIPPCERELEAPPPPSGEEKERKKEKQEKQEKKRGKRGGDEGDD
jgi:hypothetical protein